MRQLMLVTALCAALTVVVTGTGLATGPDRAKLEARGWLCFPPIPGVPGPEGRVTHCVHPNTDVEALLAGTLASVPSLNFEGSRYLGTEVLIRADLGADDRPCRQGTEPDGTYEAVDFSDPPDGIPEYFSCHHNNRL